MCVEIEDIDAVECGVIGGGVKTLYVAYAKDILTYPSFDASPTENVMTANIVMKLGKFFKKWEFDEDTCKIGFPSVGKKGSLAVEAKLECDFSGMNPAKARMLDGSLNGRLVLVAIDTIGNRHLIGEPDGRAARREPSESTTGTVLADSNMDKVIISCGVGTRKFYAGVIPIAP